VKNAFYAYELPRKKESSHKDGEEAPSADSDQRTSSSKPRVVVLGRFQRWVGLYAVF
jgi:hypothetical protein